MGSEEETVDASRNSDAAEALQEKGKVSLSKFLRNVWFLRTLIVVSGMPIAALLFVYSLIFLNTYDALGVTTSYFFWAWRDSITSMVAVQEMTGEGLALSLGYLAGAIFALSIITPHLKQAIAQSKIAQPESIKFGNVEPLPEAKKDEEQLAQEDETELEPISSVDQPAEDLGREIEENEIPEVILPPPEKRGSVLATYQEALKLMQVEDPRRTLKSATIKETVDRVTKAQEASAPYPDRAVQLFQNISQTTEDYLYTARFDPARTIEADAWLNELKLLMETKQSVVA
jgi:hypothetical protein